MQASPEDVVEVLEDADGPVASRDLQYELNLTPHELAWITRVLRARDLVVVTRHHHAGSTTTAYELLDSESNDSASPTRATGDTNEMPNDETSESKGQQVNLEGETLNEVPYEVKTRHTHEWTGDVFVLRLSDKKLEKFQDADTRRRREIVARSMRVQKHAVPTGQRFENELTKFVQAVREDAAEVA